jgi:hypothetical protein
MKHVSFIVAILFNSYLFGEDWNCVSKDSYLQDLKCTSQNGEVFSFESKLEPNSNKYEVNEDIQLDIVTFVKAIGPGKTIKASTQQGDNLSGISLAGGKIKASVAYANGDSYEGILLGAYRHGKGIYKQKEYVLEGEFIEGYLLGEGSKTYLNRNKVITGGFLDSLPNGLIEDIETYINENDTTIKRIYKGQAKNGYWHGIGYQEIKRVTELEGIGVKFGEYNDPDLVGERFWINEIVKDSPAAKSELKVYDNIVSIKNPGKPKQEAKYLTLSELVNLVAGKKGRSIELEILRFDEKNNQNQTITVRLVRDKIQAESIETYEGRFVDGNRSGYGKSTSSDGRSYEGTWKNGDFNGFGKRTWGEGNHYLGTYKDGSCEGAGMQLNQNYDIVYYGEFHECKAHGQGGSIFHNPDGSKVIKTGQFFENELNGYAEAYYPDGDVYKGNWKNDTWSGYGEIYSQELRRTITGLFEGGALKDGQGTLTTDDFKYSGLFKEGWMHGKGIKYTRLPGAESVWTDEEYVIMEKGTIVGTYELPKSEQEKRIALVVGNDAYISSRLENSVNDSVGIMKALQSKGFEVVHKTNLKQKDFKQAIWDFEELVQSYKGKVTALFYYAGHAVQIDGDNYLIPVDSKMNQQRGIELGSVNAQTVINSLSNSTEGVKIVIMDSCRVNPFKSYSRNISGGLAQISAPIGTFVAYSTAPGELALDGTSSGYGIYTGNLINALNTPGLTIEQVFKKTRMEVAKVTQGRQIPWESSSLIADFYFFK